MFRLECFIEVLEFTYLPVGKYFSCVNINWYHGEHCPRKLTKVKVWFALWSDTVYVGNQGRDEWYKLSAFCWIVFHIHWSVSFDCIFTTTFSTTIVFYAFFYVWVRQKTKTFYNRSLPNLDKPLGQYIWMYIQIFWSSLSTILQQNFNAKGFQTRIVFLTMTAHV